MAIIVFCWDILMFWEPVKIYKTVVPWFRFILDCQAFLSSNMSFPGGSLVKNPPANAGDTVQSLTWEDPLEKEIATHPSILA